MTDDAAFLAAVADRPGDPTPRLVYADWLDDRGDPRAELVRVEEELRTLPADADRYWSLKPRRNELRAGCSPDWLAALGYGTVYRPVLAPWPTADVKGRFRLLRELVERWYGVPIPDAGGRAAEVAAVEARLGRPLPVAVREWIAFALDLGEVPGRTHEVMRDEFRPSVVHLNTRFGLAVAELTEGDNLWVVPTARLTDYDPPVEWYCLQSGDFRPEGGDELPPGEPAGTLTVFALGYVLDSGYGFTTGTAGSVQSIKLMQVAREVFPPPVAIRSAQVFESDAVLAVYGSVWEDGDDVDPGRLRFNVWTRGPVPDLAVARWLEASLR